MANITKVYKISSWEELEKLVERMDLTKESLSLCGYTLNSVADGTPEQNMINVWSLFFEITPVHFIDHDEKEE